MFIQFELPSAPTWFFLSLVLAIGLFFRFNRLLSIRNWDLCLLFLLAPGLLFLRHAQGTRTSVTTALPRRTGEEVCATLAAASAVIGTPAATPANGALVLGEASWAVHRPAAAVSEAEFRVWLGYLVLLIGSGYFLLRCLLDVAIVRRPLYVPNVNRSALVWFGVVLLIVLGTKAVFAPREALPNPDRRSVVLERATTAAEAAADQLPFASAPVSNVALSNWIVGLIAVAGHVVVTAGLIWIGCRHFHSSTLGLSAAVLYLVLPYTAYHVQDIHHVFPAAIVIAALAAYRWPVVAGLLLGLGTGTVYFPLLLFPVWFGFYRGRGAWRFSAAFFAVALGFLAYFWLDPTLRPYLVSAMNLPDWRAWDFSAQPTAEGLWTGLELHYAYRVPLFIAYLILVVATAYWPSPKNLAHLIALSAALILGVQFWYADAGGIYVLWYLPLLVLLFVRPNLSERYAVEIDANRDWLLRGFRWFGRRRADRPEPVVAAPVGSSRLN